MQERKIRKTFHSKQVLEGAGVKLRRAFGNAEVPLFDPFLMLDDFRSENPADYVRGFPWHPHRGIETITYMLDGNVEHKDSIGNSGVISAGDVQWMTAGSGIIHQEMPMGSKTGAMKGFQLWANLPAKDKMMDPRYQEVKAEEIPVVKLENGVEIRVICGNINSVKGPVSDIVVEPEYLDIRLPENTLYQHAVRKDKNVFCYIYEGSAQFADDKTFHGNTTLLLFTEGDSVSIKTGNDPVRLLFLAGVPIKEPVAWGGPIVMNTEAELETAFHEYQQGTFLKHK